MPTELSLRKKLLFSATALLLPLAAVEALLWVVAPAEDPYYSKRWTTVYHRLLPAWNYWGEPPLERAWEAGSLPGVEPWETQVRMNRFGFTYAEAASRRSSPDELRVAVLGGSTAECIVLRPEARWPAVLERLLEDARPGRPVTVLNLGVSDQGTWTHLSNIAHHVVELDVDLMILMLGGNDLNRLSEDFENLVGDKFIGNRDRGWNAARLSRYLTTRTQIGRRVRVGFRSAQDRYDRPYFYDRQQEIAGYPEYPSVPEIDPAALDGYERNLVSIAALGAAHGIEVLMTTQPMLWHAGNTEAERAVFWMLGYKIDGAPRRLRPENAAALLGALNRRLIETCERRGYRCLDLDSLIPRDLEFFYDDVHFTDRGSAEVAARLRDALIEVAAPAGARGLTPAQ